MASKFINPDDELVQYLLAELIGKETPGLPRHLRLDRPVFGDVTRGGVIIAGSEDAMRLASPLDRKAARADVAGTGGPGTIRRAKKPWEMSLEQTLLRSQPRHLQDPLTRLQEDIAMSRKRGIAAKTLSILDQEATRRSDIMRRIMRVLKTQPGLGLIMLLAGLPAVLAASRGSGGDK